MPDSPRLRTRAGSGYGRDLPQVSLFSKATFFSSALMFAARPERHENLSLARLANLLTHYTGNENCRKTADQAMRFATTPAIANQYAAAGLLLADRELTRSPTHLTIVGSKQSGEAAKLFETALQYASGYKRVEWWDRAEGAMPNPDVEYPQLAAFVYTQKICSSPICKPELLLTRANQLAQ